MVLVLEWAVLAMIYTVLLRVIAGDRNKNLLLIHCVWNLLLFYFEAFFFVKLLYCSCCSRIFCPVSTDRPVIVGCIGLLVLAVCSAIKSI